MVHILLAVYADSSKQAEFIDVVNSMSYEYQGDLKGETKPFISEVKLYDIRIKEEVAPLFLRDVNAMFAGEHDKFKKDTDLKGMKESRKTFNLMNFALKWLRKITPFRTIPRAPGNEDPKYKRPGWRYTFFIGALKDPKTEEGEEIL